MKLGKMLGLIFLLLATKAIYLGSKIYTQSFCEKSLDVCAHACKTTYDVLLLENTVARAKFLLTSMKLTSF
jgi:hypothetical protein